MSQAQTLTKSFQSHAEQVVRSVRNAFGMIAAALPGSPLRANELQKALSIDKTLAWKIATVINDDDSFSAAKQLPGPAGIDIFLEAVRKKNVPSNLIEQARSSIRDFEDLIRIHAGDRASFEMMISGFATRDRYKIQIGHRKAAFQAQRYVWGVEAKTHLGATFVSVAAHDPSRVSVVYIRGYVGFRRIRPNVSWVIARPRHLDNDGKIRDVCTRLPLDPCLGSTDVPLMRDFCSASLPELRKVPLNDGFYEVEVVEGPVGDTAAVTLITGEKLPELPRYSDEHNRFARTGVHSFTPAETLIIDVVIHQDVFGRVKPDLAAYSEIGGGPLFPSSRHRPLLPPLEQVEYLGKGSQVMHTPDVPDCPRLAQAVFSTMGWEESRFDVFRARVPYPVVPASYMLTYPLPEAPKG